MAEDKVIKSGQITLPRLVFLAACGVALFVVVYFGLLIYGYILLTLVLCGLLLLVALDWGVTMEKLDLSGGSSQVAAASGPSGGATISESSAAAVPVRGQVARKRAKGQPKRRR
jgi:hypothetical protein